MAALERDLAERCRQCEDDTLILIGDEMALNLIWTQDPETLSETGWIRWLLGGLDFTEYVAPGLDLFKENALYIISSNRHPLSRLPTRFVEGLGSVEPKGLFQISDESYSGGYDIYKNFDFVLRNHYSSIFQHPGIMVLPLGPTRYEPNRRPMESAIERDFLWSFAGTRTAARMEMYRAFKNIEPYDCHFYDSRKHEKPPLDGDSFLTLLSRTIFCPCPMGNVMLETFRLYECLEMGCIPIVGRRRWMPYYDRLMPGHALPTFPSWREAGQFVEVLSRDKSRIVTYQREIAEWWRSYKVKLRSDVTSFVLSGLEGLFRSSLRHWHCRKGVNHQVWRVVELLKHASRASLQERVGITTRRAIDRVWSPRGGD
jgi:hypothetical protein